MNRILFLGLGPIASTVISTLEDSNSQYTIDVLTSTKMQRFGDGSPFSNYIEWKDTKNLKMYNLVINSWRTLESHNDNSRLEVLVNLAKQPNIVFINLSTVAVYGECEHPKNELSNISPKNDYGIEKLQIEQFIRTLNFFKVINLRISNVYGHPTFSDFLNAAANSYLNHEILFIANPDSIFRDFISIQDLKQIIEILIANRGHSDFEGFLDINIATGKSFSLKTILDVLQEETRNGISFEEIEPERGTILKSFINTSKMSDLFGKTIDSPLDLIQKEFKKRITK